MRKTLLISFYLFVALIIKAQKYQPIDSSSVWNDWYTQKNMNGGCGGPGCNYENAKTSVQFKGYKINNGITWLKMYKSQIHYWAACSPPCYANNYSFGQFTNIFFGYVWDDTLTKKVYYTDTLPLNFTPTTNNVLYDYLNKNIGDSLWWKPIGYPNSATINKYLITSIDSVLINTKYHKRYTINFTPYMPSYPLHVIEGIGSFRGAWDALFSDFEQRSSLVCVSFGTSGLSVSNYTSFTNTAAGCGTLNAIQEIETPLFSLYPNPATNKIEIRGIDINEVLIFDPFGKLILINNSNERIIDINSLQKGVYFIKIKSGELTYTTKFLKE